MLHLTVGPGGSVALDGRAVPLSDLSAVLAARISADPRVVAAVRGSAGATYQDVIHVLDLARGAGVRTLSLDPAQ